MGKYFCPDCGWEGDDPICAVCGNKTESLEVDPATGKASEGSLPIDDEDELDEGFEEDKFDDY